MKPRDALLWLLMLALLIGAGFWLAGRARSKAPSQTHSYARSFERGQAGAPGAGRAAFRDPKAPSSGIDAAESQIHKYQGDRYATY
ncbi:MAG: hypothetical protein IPK79_08090 [Vampirovibrionales bacterium]|nr:hypothetical protein [Vampirovibrionales bacterium]